eukprot:3639815-Rhodomonas_salina.1
MAYSTRQGSRRGRASQHALLMAQIADLLATWEGHILLVKVKSHMGMPFNAAVDKAADAGAESENNYPDIEGLQALPLQFRSCLASVPAPTSVFTRARSHAAAMPDPPDASSDSADPQADPTPPAGWKLFPKEVARLVRQLSHSSMNDLVLSRHTQFTDFTRRGECIRPALGAAHCLSGCQALVWYQVTAGMYATQAYLARIGVHAIPIP